MKGDFRDQVVVVTGASSGVGRAIARAFGAAGAKVGLIARTEPALRHAAREIRNTGGEALVLPLDVSDAPAVFEAARRAADEWGRIDLWVNVAMVSVFSPVVEMTPEEFRRVTEVSYLGFVHGTLAALEHMVPRDRGTIIQIGSALAYRSIPLQSAYCAAKAAIRGFTDSLRSELIHDRSRVKITMLQLPAVNTPQFEVVRSRMPNRPQPVPPIFQPELIARATLYAARHPRRELWLGGSAVEAILGQRIIPGVLDRYLATRAYRDQQTDEPARPDRPDNLFRPIGRDFGAHGRFDKRAHRRSVEVLVRTHPIAALSLALAATTTAALLASQAWRRR